MSGKLKLLQPASLLSVGNPLRYSKKKNSAVSTTFKLQELVAVTQQRYAYNIVGTDQTLASFGMTKP